jgi:hypothetical protein
MQCDLVDELRYQGKIAQPVNSSRLDITETLTGFISLEPLLIFVDIILRITNTNDGALMVKQSVHIDSLVDMGSVGYNKFTTLPANAIFFKSDSSNSYFISEALHNSLLVHGLLPAINRSKESEDEMNKVESEEARLERNVNYNELLNVEKDYSGAIDKMSVAMAAEAKAFVRRQKLQRVSLLIYECR